MIGINPAPFFPRQRLGWRKFLSSWNDGTLLQEDDCWGFAESVVAGAALKGYSGLKCSPRQRIEYLVTVFSTETSDSKSN